MPALTNGPNLGLLINGNKGDDHYTELMKLWRGLDGLVQPRVIGWGTTTPPGSPSNGDCYIPGSGATGAWSGHANKIVRYYTVGEGASAWEVYTPKQGWKVHLLSDNRTIYFNGTIWAYTEVKDNYAGGAAPAVTDDSGDGYAVGSKWYDTSVSPVEVYLCTDASVGAAVWQNITVDTTDLGTMAVQNASAVTVTGGSADNLTLGATTAAPARVTTLTTTDVGVIAANSSSPALKITQTGAGNALTIEDSASTDSTPVVVDGTGKLIVGAVGSVLGTTYTPAVEIFGADPGSAGIGHYQFSNDALGATTQFNKTRNSAYNGHTVVQSGDNLGHLSFAGSDGTGYIRGASIVASVDGTPGTNDMPGRLVFSTTADGASSPTERMRITSTGCVGIGGTPPLNQTFRVAKNLTGSTSCRTVYVDNQVQSDVTNAVSSFYSIPSTAASGFTLSNLSHYLAEQGVIGAGSAVTNQFGFVAASSLVGAVTNYGFYGDIASGSGRWNLYMNGSAANYLGGALTVAAATTISASGQSADPMLLINSSTQSTTPVPTIVRLATSSGGSSWSTTLPWAGLEFYSADPAAVCADLVTIAATSAGSYCRLVARVKGASGSVAEVAEFTGDSGIGRIRFTPSIGHSSGIAVSNVCSWSAAITTGTGMVSSMSLSDAASATTLRNFSVVATTLGSGATITTQKGYYVDSGFINATNNYGFYGNIASGTGRFNLYMNGTAANYLAGALGVGTTSLATGANLVLRLASGGAGTVYSIDVDCDVASGTTAYRGSSINLSKTAGAFTVTTMTGYSVSSDGVTGGTITTQTGFLVTSSLAGGTANYGFRGQVTAATGAYNLYMDGTAANYFAGDMQVDKTVTAGGTTGAQTINKNAGSVNFAAGPTTLTVTNNRVTANSIIIATVATNDATMKSVAVVAGAGSFTLYPNASATAETRVNFWIVN